MQLTQRLLDEGDDTTSTKDAHWRAYDAFCRANDLDPRDDLQQATPLFAAALLEQGRLESTVKVYLKHIKDRLEEARLPFNKVMRALDVRIARRGHDHAMDLEVEDLGCLLAKMQSTISSTSAVTLAFMWVTGLRCEDLSEIFGKQVTINRDFLQVEVRLSKTFRNSLDRAEIRIPVAWMPDMAIELSRALVQKISHAKRSAANELVFGTPSVEVLNAHLRRAWKACGHRLIALGAHRSPTTYTFRRSFIHMIVRKCTDVDGVVSWARVSTFTLHKCEKTVRAYYNTHVSDERT